MKISRPTMISVLKENTKGRTHMNRKQMWKIIEEKELVDQTLELEKGLERKPGSGRIARKSVEVVDLDTNETKYFPSLSEASKYFGKTKIYFIYNNGRAWENKKIAIINHKFVISTRILSPANGRENFFVDVDKIFLVK